MSGAEARLTSIRAATMLIREDAGVLYAFAEEMRTAIGEATLVQLNGETRMPSTDWARIADAALKYALLMRQPPAVSPDREGETT